ncbi:MAG: folylpolyglutamate synthase/dihydrofolate synthase family protein [Acutalibacteraceae bacterium]|nr:folylpolyglutamate synthase/dihydrofolate synthase family protein [Acutalibacteraceae bacterium]
MNCKEAIEYIHSLEKFGIRPGMERIKALCSELGNPQDKLKVIHVAGTNGKGSTSTIISNILQQNGFNTGLFISPYVSDFRERIQYNGNMIEMNELAECVEKVKNAIDILSDKGIQPTEFEALTATAFLYFKKKNCDFVVLEVGLGGRLDSTNVILAPYVSVITSISMDHTAILGDTIEDIAAEKCGIIKFGAETVIYPYQYESVLKIIKKTCSERCNTFRIPDINKLNIFGESLEGTSACYDGIDFVLPLAGEHMIYNACTAVEAVRSLSRFGITISDSAIKNGIEKTIMPARMELIKKKPVVILDGGHNEGCAAALSDFIKKHLSDKRIIMVSSLMADKDYTSYLSAVCPFADTFIAAKADVPRALSSSELCESAKKYCKNCYDIPEPHKAVTAAYNIIQPDDVLIICGSFYLAGEIRDILHNF